LKYLSSCIDWRPNTLSKLFFRQCKNVSSPGATPSLPGERGEAEHVFPTFLISILKPATLLTLLNGHSLATGHQQPAIIRPQGIFSSYLLTLSPSIFSWQPAAFFIIPIHRPLFPKICTFARTAPPGFDSLNFPGAGIY